MTKKLSKKMLADSVAAIVAGNYTVEHRLPVRGRYVFTVDAMIKATSLGETPQGFRVDMEYVGGSISTNSAAFLASWKDRMPADAPQTPEEVAAWLDSARRESDRPSKLGTLLDWYGLKGSLLSGNDWALIRNDGVAELSSRVTLQEERLKEGTGGRLINAELVGGTDLWTGAPELRPPGIDVYRQWKSGGREPRSLRLALSVRFQLAQASQPWAATEFTTAAGFWKYEILPRHQFLANTQVDVTANNEINHIRFDVWRVEGFQPPVGEPIGGETE